MTFTLISCGCDLVISRHWHLRRERQSSLLLMWLFSSPLDSGLTAMETMGYFLSFGSNKILFFKYISPDELLLYISDVTDVFIEEKMFFIVFEFSLVFCLWKWVRAQFGVPRVDLLQRSFLLPTFWCPVLPSEKNKRLYMGFIRNSWNVSAMWQCING